MECGGPCERGGGGGRGKALFVSINARDTTRLYDRPRSCEGRTSGYDVALHLRSWEEEEAEEEKDYTSLLLLPRLDAILHGTGKRQKTAKSFQLSQILLPLRSKRVQA